ncbi:MAG: ATP-dependent DNA ligase [Candidatus Bathyarchaeota archaeon]|nr:ATP-dependent DNA ligase [Candidatus Bathyarchaeota archaeon]
MKYSIITDTYAKIEATSKRLEMTEYLVQLLKRTPTSLIGKVAYLTQGKLYPDFVGIELGMAEKMVISVIARTIGVSKQKIVQVYNTSGDLGSTIEVLKSTTPTTRLMSGASISVTKVYEVLDRIAHTTGKGSVEAKINLLTRLITDATPEEAKYLTRTITGRLRLGIGDMTFLDALAIAFGGGKEARQDVEKAYNMSSDLGSVAETIAKSGMEGILKFQVRLGHPIRPMLAERLTSAKEVLDKLGGQGSAEYKYDGLRMQAHISADDIILFSRRLENITSQFPDVVHALRNSIQVRDAIIEGEAVAVDPNTNEVQPFQVITRRRGRKHAINEMAEEIPITLILFDALYMDGLSLLDKDYYSRRACLEKAITETVRVKITHPLLVTKAPQLDEYMMEAVENGCEGLVIKSVKEDASYQAGARGFLWIKYKRDYKIELGDTLDLVAVGAFAGRGRRTGTFGALLMAAYNGEKDVFETVCKLGTGFNDEILSQLPVMFQDEQINQVHPRVESKIEADYWFLPRRVLEVRGAEVTLSPSHTCGIDIIGKDTGLAVRFPRFTGKWRHDKSPQDATTVEEIITMYSAQLKSVEAR